MELNNDIYQKIVQLSEKGDEFVDNREYKKAILLYKKALSLIPKNKYEWEASLWLFVALGDTYYLDGNYKESLNFMFEALNCQGGLENPFVFLRIGECFFEINNKIKAREYLLKAYMLDENRIFNGENEKYLNAIKDLI